MELPRRPGGAAPSKNGYGVTWPRIEGVSPGGVGRTVKSGCNPQLSLSTTRGFAMAATARVLDRLTVAPIPGGWQVGGEIDANTAPALAEALTTHRPDIEGRQLVVDLSGVRFMDSRGLDALLDVRGRLAVDGDVLTLRRPSRCVARLLEITQLRRAFRIEQQRILFRHHKHRRRGHTHR